MNETKKLVKNQRVTNHDDIFVDCLHVEKRVHVNKLLVAKLPYHFMSDKCPSYM